MLRMKFMVAALIFGVATSTIGTTTGLADGPVNRVPQSSVTGPGVSASAKDKTPQELKVVQVGSGESNFTAKEPSHDIVKTVSPYTYDYMMHDLNLLQQKYPSYMRYRSLGKTADGREIVDCVIGNPNAPKQILIQAGMHGREHINSLLMMQQIEYILENYETGYWDGYTLRDMFNQVQLHILPMVNPDGVTISQLGFDGLWTQSVREQAMAIYQQDAAAGYVSADSAVGTKYWKNNAMGVDINQNFDCNWYDGGKITRPSSLYYKGTAPVSEPETKALVSLINSYSNWKFTISVHSTGSLIYMDTKGNQVYAPSAGFAFNLHELSGYDISSEESSGKGFKDWCQTKTNPIPSVTIETGRRACPDNFVEYESIWQKNKFIWLYELRYAYEH